MIKKPSEIDAGVKMTVQLIIESAGELQKPRGANRPWSLHMLGNIGNLDIHSADGGPVAFTGVSIRPDEENETNGALIVNAVNTYDSLQDIVSYAYYLGMRNSEALLKSVQSIASEAFEHWDADEDMKVGKILQALAGKLPGYRIDTDLIASSVNMGSQPL